MRKGRLVGGAIVILVMIAVFWVRPGIVRMSATDVSGDVALWLYATDLVPGDRFDARVWLDDALSNETIAGVWIYGRGGRERWVAGHRDNELSFDIEVPLDTTDELELAIEVVTFGRFGSTTERFDVALPVYSRSTSWLRRGVKALLAVASWFALMFADTARRRWYVRRHRRASRAWGLALVPVIAAGWFWFAELLEHATRVHGWWFAMPALAVWLVALRVSARRSRYTGMTSYLVEQVMVDAAAEVPFRGGRTQAPMQPVGELELAWHAAGFVVERLGKDLQLLLPERGTVKVPVPASESFGGEPFEIFASDVESASVALSSVTPLLGELRAFGGGRQLRVSASEVRYG